MSDKPISPLRQRPDRSDRRGEGFARAPQLSRSQARPTHHAGGARRGQRSDPHEQALAGGGRRPRARLIAEWLPKYAPEPNDIEPVWHALKAHHLAHQTFADADALELRP